MAGDAPEHRSAPVATAGGGRPADFRGAAAIGQERERGGSVKPTYIFVIVTAMVLASAGLAAAGGSSARGGTTGEDTLGGETPAAEAAPPAEEVPPAEETEGGDAPPAEDPPEETPPAEVVPPPAEVVPPPAEVVPPPPEEEAPEPDADALRYADQLAADARPIPGGMGAIFVPAMTDPTLEPAVDVYRDSRRVDGGRGRRADLRATEPLHRPRRASAKRAHPAHGRGGRHRGRRRPSSPPHGRPSSSMSSMTTTSSQGLLRPDPARHPGGSRHRPRADRRTRRGAPDVAPHPGSLQGGPPGRDLPRAHRLRHRARRGGRDGPLRARHGAVDGSLPRRRGRARGPGRHRPRGVLHHRHRRRLPLAQPPLPVTSRRGRRLLRRRRLRGLRPALRRGAPLLHVPAPARGGRPVPARGGAPQDPRLPRLQCPLCPAAPPDHRPLHSLRIQQHHDAGGGTTSRSHRRSPSSTPTASSSRPCRTRTGCASGLPSLSTISRRVGANVGAVRSTGSTSTSASASASSNSWPRTSALSATMRRRTPSSIRRW